MRMHWILALLIMTSSLWAQKVESEKDFVNESYEEFLRGKKKQSYLWYSGTVIGGVGVLSLIVGSHFDGKAAEKRNPAAILHEGGEEENRDRYEKIHSEMNDLRDQRDVFWQVGLGLGVLGAGLMIMDFAISEDVTVAPKMDGVQLAVRF